MSANNSHYIQKLWNDWVKNKDENIGNELINHYMYLVQFHVERIATYIPESFDKNDLKSLGLMGLFDALNKFEPSRNLKFDTYATIRIHGSIMDGLRKEDWLPRTLRDKSKKIEKVSEEMEQRLGRTASTAEIAAETGMTKEEVEATMMDTFYANMLSTDMVIQHADAEETTDIASTIKDASDLSPESFVLDNEIKDQLQKGIKELKENEQIVISLFYVEELTLTEIGSVLNLTTSRISQIHKKAILKLKDILMKLKVTSS